MLRVQRKQRRSVLVLVLVLASVSASADAAPEREPGTAPAAASAAELFAELAKLPGLRANFREEKHLALLKVPISSTGTVLYSPPSLLVRRTDAPVWSVLEIDERSIRYRDEAGSSTISAGRDHPAKVFVQVFIDVVRGDLTAVSKRFRVSYSVDAPSRRWTLDLVPLAAELKNVASIRIVGVGTELEKTVIVERSGDRSVTEFSAVRSSSKPSARELEELRQEKK